MKIQHEKDLRLIEIKEKLKLELKLIKEKYSVSIIISQSFFYLAIIVLSSLFLVIILSDFPFSNFINFILAFKIFKNSNPVSIKSSKILSTPVENNQSISRIDIENYIELGLKLNAFEEALLHKQLNKKQFLN